MHKTKLTGGTRTTRFDLIAGEAEVCPIDAENATIALRPGAGTVKVEFTVSSGDDLDLDDAMWVPAEGLGAGGIVSSLYMDGIPTAITAVKLTASVNGARVEIAR